MNKRWISALAAAILLFGTFASASAQSDALWYPQITQQMPIVSIITENGNNHFAKAYTREHKLQGMIDYVNGAVSVSNCEQQEALSNEKAQVKVRGNWTLDYPKKSIRIKFDKKQSMLGLNENQAYKSWVLLAEWKDLSMLNTPAALFLAQNILGRDGYYCTDYRFVQLYINGEYWGVYLLVEQQEANPGRVEIARQEKDAPDRYTGYLIEYDAYFQEEAALPGGDPVFEVYHTGLDGEQYGYTVKSDIINNRQLSFLRTLIRLIYRTCYAAVNENRHFTFNEKYTELVAEESTSVQETVGQVIDLPSLVDTYLLNEIISNPDLGWSSFYLSVDLSKNGSKKLTFQAPWDFDSAFGIRSGYEDSRQIYAAHAGNPWLRLFASQPWFMEMVKERWQEIKAQGIPEKTLALILTLQETYAPCFEQNSARWPSRIAQGNHELIEELNNCQSQQEAADYLYRWLSDRFSFLDEQWQ